MQNIIEAIFNVNSRSLWSLGWTNSSLSAQIDVKKSTNIKYYIIALLCGIVCKLYDDISDNPNIIFKKLKKNKYLTEWLKGMHYILFSTLSLFEPLFFLIFYSAVVFNYISDKTAYQTPYDFSVFFSLGMLFFLINYSKVSISSFNIYDILLILFFYFTMIIEPLFKGFLGEVSMLKLFARIYTCFTGFVCYFLCNSIVSKCLIGYYVGYCSCSSISQYYSLLIATKKNNDIHSDSLWTILKPKVYESERVDIKEKINKKKNKNKKKKEKNMDKEK